MLLGGLRSGSFLRSYHQALPMTMYGTANGLPAASLIAGLSR